jgi:hypothetical protein
MQLGFLGGAVICGIIGLILLFLFIKAFRLGKASNKWPTVEGTIISSKIAEDDEGYKPLITFSYNVFGEEMTSSVIQPLHLVSIPIDPIKTAETKAAKYPTGKTVSVYYKPDNPKKAVLEPGINRDTYFLLAVGLFFLIGGLVFGYVSIVVIETIPDINETLPLLLSSILNFF